MDQRQLILIGGSKGGVGKSLLTMTVLDYLTSKGEAPFLIETDNSNPDTFKTYKNAVQGTVLDLDNVDGWLELLNYCAYSNHRVIVINTAARNNAAVAQFGERLMLGLAELPISLTTLWVINTQLDSLELLKQYRAALPLGAVHVVRNEFHGSNFALYDDSELRADIEAHGGQSLTMPKLAERVTQELYGKQRLTIEQVASSPSSSFGHQIEAKRWRHCAARMLDPVFV